MNIKRSILPWLAVGLASIAVGVRAQDYPNRPLHLIVPFAPGGAADATARALSGPLAKRLGQPVIVENKAGGGATIGANFVAKAPADGYTLLYTTPGPQITNPHLMASLPYDAVKDLVPVSRIAFVPSVLVVNSNLNVKTVNELIAYSKANPGKINFASAGLGATSHLAGELFKTMADIQIEHVPYKGTGPALQDLLAGNVQMSIDSVSVYLPHIKSGALRPLGTSMLKRSSILPDVPSISERLTGFDATPVNYLSVRSGTARTIIDRLNKELSEVLNTPEIRTRFQAIGLEPQSSTPEEMAEEIKRESEKWKRIIQSSGAKLE